MKFTQLKSSTPIPMSAEPPFLPPYQRELQAEDLNRLQGWFDDLLPGGSVEVIEWVGADPRQPLHAVEISFATASSSPIILVMKVEDIECSHLQDALGIEEAS